MKLPTPEEAAEARQRETSEDLPKLVQAIKTRALEALSLGTNANSVVELADYKPVAERAMVEAQAWARDSGWILTRMPETLTIRLRPLTEEEVKAGPPVVCPACGAMK